MAHRHQSRSMNARHDRPTILLAHLVVVLVVTALGAACAPTRSPGAAAPHATATPVAPEQYGVMIQQALAASDVAPLYAGLFFEDNQHIILVTDRSQAVHDVLVAHGIPAAAFTIRTVNDSLADLQQAGAAAEGWLDTLSSHGAVAVNVADNKVVLAVERQPLVDLLGYDPGDEPIPYERWPASLQAALRGLVPGVDVELRAGFSGGIT